MQRNDWMETGIEPPLGELMADPLMDLIQRRDRITAADTWQAVRAARERLSRHRGSKEAEAA